MLSDIRFQGYNASYLKRDLAAGLIVGIVAIPLGMAFAIASGVRPEYGIYTVILAGLLVSLLGGSKFQIAGPTGAFVPILFAIVMEHGYENLLIAGFMAGIMLVLLGLFKLGSLMRYIPRPVTIGFTTGIAVIIFSGQIAHFLGLRNVKKKEAFHENMREIAVHIETVNWYSVGTAVICLAVLLMTSRLTTKVPPALAGLIAATLAAVLFFRGKIDTIGSTYGAIPTGLPTFKLPALSWDLVVDLLPAAFVIAMLGGIESLLSAMVADRMGGDKHNSNKELIGQGIANMVTPLFGGIPATGAIARTATNIKNGSASPLSGIIHALVVLVVLLVFAPYASHIPLAAMAPILMFVAWNMSERREFMHVLKTRTGDSVVLVVTFLLTVFADLTTAVGAGLVLAAVLFIKRMSGTLKLEGVLPDPQDKLVKPAQGGGRAFLPADRDLHRGRPAVLRHLVGLPGDDQGQAGRGRAAADPSAAYGQGQRHGHHRRGGFGRHRRRSQGARRHAAAHGHHAGRPADPGQQRPQRQDRRGAAVPPHGRSDRVRPAPGEPRALLGLPAVHLRRVHRAVEAGPRGRPPRPRGCAAGIRRSDLSFLVPLCCAQRSLSKRYTLAGR
ncbi:SulP family sulfate permease [Paenibacillus mucilaginosus KNP414]|uniref:SulP family sulfate permease n=1 Tax=Paenibacillus mucilaginosus (strain KNP414) TaxID=1036673 RepID=F8FI93_PAEMK|nr:SulP family sulfate permease [Paenibacillus mucilaginosus KNP414]